jgi:hypothetical protein
MQDFLRDWYRWSLGERIGAAGIVSFILVFVPFMVTVNSHGF